VSYSIKPGVRLTGLQPQAVLAYVIAGSVYDAFDAPCVMTSAVEGKHKNGSMHVLGCAIDLRTSVLPVDRHEPLAMALRTSLGSEYDVVLEADHIHIEWQPKPPLVTP
jgi:hypothetical protein